MTKSEMTDAPTPIEVTVTLKGDDSTYKQKFLEYREVMMSEYDPIIKELIEQAKQAYKGTVEKISIKVSLTIE